MSAGALRYEAIVVRRSLYGEADRIVTLMTREAGLQRGIARNARASRRRFGGALDLFSRIEVEMAPRRSRGAEALARLESAELVDAHLGLRRSIERLETASLAAEALSLLVHEGERVPELFTALASLLAALSAGELPGAPALGRLWFLLRVLGAVGLAPLLEACVRCGRRPEEFGRALFEGEEGGLVCERCAPPVGPAVLPAAGVRVFAQVAAAGDLEALAEVRVSPGGLETLWRLGRDCFEHRAGRRLQSLETRVVAPRD